MAPSATLGDVVIKMNGMERTGKLVIRSKVTSYATDKKHINPRSEVAEKIAPSAALGDVAKKMNDARNVAKGDELSKGFKAFKLHHSESSGIPINQRRVASKATNHNVPRVDRIAEILLRNKRGW